MLSADGFNDHMMSSADDARSLDKPRLKHSVSCAALARAGWPGLVTIFPWLLPVVKPLARRFPDKLSRRVSPLLQASTASQGQAHFLLQLLCPLYVQRPGLGPLS